MERWILTEDHRFPGVLSQWKQHLDHMTQPETTWVPLQVCNMNHLNKKKTKTKDMSQTSGSDRMCSTAAASDCWFDFTQNQERSVCPRGTPPGRRVTLQRLIKKTLTSIRVHRKLLDSDTVVKIPTSAAGLRNFLSLLPTVACICHQSGPQTVAPPIMVALFIVPRGA